jgi:hypothetical protein
MTSLTLLEVFLGFFCASLALTFLRNAAPGNEAG